MSRNRLLSWSKLRLRGFQSGNRARAVAASPSSPAPRRTLMLAAGLLGAATLGGCAVGDGPGGGPRLPWSPALEDVDWRFVSVLGKPVPDAPDATGNQFRLDSSGARFVASVGCNRIAGPFVIKEGRLRITPGVSTRRACPGPLGDAERRLVGALGATTAYRLADGRLELLAGRTALAILERR